MKQLSENKHSHFIFARGSSETEKRQDSQAFIIFKLCGYYCAVAIFFLVFFGIQAFLGANETYGLTLIGLALFTAASYLLIWTAAKHYLANYLVSALMATLCFFLFTSGGVDGTGPLWYFVFPPLALFLLGARTGLISAVALLTITLFYLVVSPFETQYSSTFIQRMIAVYFAITALSYLFAHFKNTAEMQLEDNLITMEINSNTDKLSGLANRRYMEKILRSEAARFERYGTPSTLVMLDIDFFKKINDNLGHHYGDYVIQTLKDIFSKSLRQLDLPSRWGGEEFLILLPNTSLQAALLVTERVRKTLSEYSFSLDDVKYKVTASFGVCELQKSESLAQTLQRIDNCLYQAKENGRNCIVSEP